MLKKLLLSILMTSSISSCAMPEGWNWGAAPRPFYGTGNFPPATTDYGRGFKAGCVIAFSSTGEGAFAGVIPMYIDAGMLSGNPDYKTGWMDGQEQCTYITDHDVI